MPFQPGNVTLRRSPAGWRTLTVMPAVPKSRKFLISPFGPVRPNTLRKRIITTRETVRRPIVSGTVPNFSVLTKDGDAIAPQRLRINLTNKDGLASTPPAYSCQSFLARKPEFIGMNTIRLAVGILFVVLASKTCTLAMAQDLEQPAEASVLQVDPPEHRVSLSAAHGENANPVRPDDRLQRALSVTVPASDPTVPAPTNSDRRRRQSRSRRTMVSTDVAVPLVATHVLLSTDRSRHYS